MSKVFRAVVARRTGYVVLGLVVVACKGKPPPVPPEPKDITVSVDGPCREGGEVPIRPKVTDAEGSGMNANVTWTIDPPGSGTADGTVLRCSKEGELRVTATAASAKASVQVVVGSPLIGFWVRRGDQKAGMKVRVEAEKDGLSAYVVEPPGIDALAFIKRDFPQLTADPILKCSAKVWAPGVKKWKAVKRSSDRRWTLADLSKPMVLQRCNRILGECSQQCAVGKTEYIEDYELTLVNDQHAEVRRTTTGSEDVQRWERGSGPDAGVEADATDASAVIPPSSASGAASSPPGIGAKSPKTIRCPRGLKAEPFKLGCNCGEGQWDDAKGMVFPAHIEVPDGCHEHPDARGDACIFRCN